MNDNKKKLILLELNEINFEVVSEYVNKFDLRNLKKIINTDFNITNSEKKYSQLEPWIQWVSAHTGLDASEHKVFRLGDIINSPHINQIFEEIESKGFSVGCISPMNTLNKLKKPKYFIPDPWTKTNSDGSFWSRNLSNAISQAVNDNSSKKIKLSTIIILIFSLIRFARLKNYLVYLKLVLFSLRYQWNRSLFLDLFLSDVHFCLLESKKPDFSTLFLNAGAHIQHHYFLMAEYGLKNISRDTKNKTSTDPIKDMLSIYDKILGEYLSYEGYNLIVATGLSQTPHTHPTYYYRPTNHNKFFNNLGVKYKKIIPRMTRDFLVEYVNQNEALNAEIQLKQIRSKKDNKEFFTIDNRGSSLFITLSYDHPIDQNHILKLHNRKEINVYPLLTFVAIKNGEHNEVGYSFFIGDVKKFKPLNNSHVKNIYFSIKDFFSV